MSPQTFPLLTFSDTVLWLKVALSVATLVLLWVRYRKASASRGHSVSTNALAVLIVLFALAVFHNLGASRNGSFVHYGEMFHYYMGSKYFAELGYQDLYNAVLVADTEQGDTLAGIPFYTDLRTYQNAPREAATRDASRVRGLFSSERWEAFKDDVSFFKQATASPRAPGLFFLLMDHGYNGSPVSTFVLGLLSNAVPVSAVSLLAWIDVALVGAMIALVFHTFGLEMGVLFSVYFSVNILNDHGYVSGSLLRYDWLLYIVAAVCLLEKRRHAWAAFFLTLAAMLRVFPALLFYGVAVAIVRRLSKSRVIDRDAIRFALAAAATGLLLFVLPATTLGSVLKPWQEFSTKAALHDDGVYVNHLGLRGIALFEPSHLSFDAFVAAYDNGRSPDVVRNWQDEKERELQRKRPALAVAAFVVLLCVTAILWKGRASESEAVIWPLTLIYATSFPSHYYYAFLCLFPLLFFRRTTPLSQPAALGAADAFVPLCLLLSFNVCALVTDHFGPTPIVFYTLVNLYLFVCMAAILGYELYASCFRKAPVQVPAADPPTPRHARRRRRPPRSR